MYTTTQLDNGTLNNYAVEPKMNYAEYPSLYEQKRYIKQAAIATFLVSALVFISFVVS
ncbi:MAG: ssl1498 family light-harvesting-like protein [Pleurocapsa sp. MO_192.B19]|nr:ssl1498 family light-harvesting-like protein [Pleurocapsa sp. MO_192.B19]